MDGKNISSASRYGRGGRTICRYIQEALFETAMKGARQERQGIARLLLDCLPKGVPARPV